MLKECDLVMKGGITSGVIYPRLIARLSQTYKLRNIGGTSAGAIAAGAAAAAQLGVHAGSNPSAFGELDALSELLGRPATGRKGSMLLNLFQPQRQLRRHFRLLIGMLNAPSPFRMILRAGLGTIRQFPLGALAGGLPGLLLLSHTAGIEFAISLFVLITGLVLGAAVNALLSLGRALPGNYFGLCNGSGEDTALTPWLTQYLNRLAGKQSGEPLTFGELWAGTIRLPGEAAPAVGPDAPVIQLAMMTTAVNLGRPFRLPFESADLYFVEEELRQFFPKAVSDWLVAHARPSETATQLRTPAQTFHALPQSEDMPVVFAVRLSLGFPILLSAVPLYAVDRTLDRNNPSPTHATRIYFSDGGICSNFPVHFFDNPLPARPTFAVNLRGFHPDHPDERVWMPEPLRNNQGLRNHYRPLPDAPGLRSVVAFLGSIATTMQDWRDQLQLAMPGFRDRIVHVSHEGREGGLNLNMEPHVIRPLSDSGAKAAEALIGAFDERGWDNHQRIRIRTALSVLQQLLDRIAASPSFEEIVRNPKPPSYKFAAPQDAAHAIRLLQELRNLANSLRAENVDFNAAAPKPSPEIRIGPRV